MSRNVLFAPIRLALLLNLALASFTPVLAGQGAKLTSALEPTWKVWTYPNIVHDVWTAGDVADAWVASNVETDIPDFALWVTVDPAAPLPASTENGWIPYSPGRLTGLEVENHVHFPPATEVTATEPDVGVLITQNRVPDSVLGLRPVIRNHSSTFAPTPVSGHSDLTVGLGVAAGLLLGFLVGLFTGRPGR